MNRRPHLHINVDHVATVRQARREAFPDPVEWALAAMAAGADGITCHLRKDRRHFQDDDVRRLREAHRGLLNLEVSLDAEMLGLAEGSGADAFCLVPENRQEVTTEGGLDVCGERARLADAIPRLVAAGGVPSIFIDPDARQLDAAAELGAPFVELHTGAFAQARGADQVRELERLISAARHAHDIGLRVNAGHGLDYHNISAAVSIPHVEEFNIGFAIVARALFDGVAQSVQTMQALIAAGPKG
ncbi:MAG: pyridoxine 5'-phosphate synthase [Planctomycetota bacterium]